MCFFRPLLSKVIRNSQVERKRFFCKGGGSLYDWWGSLWQRGKLMSQNHESSCLERPPLHLPSPPPNTHKKAPSSAANKRRRRHDNRKRHCFAPAVINFLYMQSTFTVRKFLTQMSAHATQRNNYVAFKIEQNTKNTWWLKMLAKARKRWNASSACLASTLKEEVRSSFVLTLKWAFFFYHHRDATNGLMSWWDLFHDHTRPPLGPQQMALGQKYTPAASLIGFILGDRYTFFFFFLMFLSPEDTD